MCSLGALKDVLYKDDKLVEDLASSFEPTSIQGMYYIQCNTLVTVYMLCMFITLYVCA